MDSQDVTALAPVQHSLSARPEPSASGHAMCSGGHGVNHLPLLAHGGLLVKVSELFLTVLTLASA